LLLVVLDRGAPDDRPELGNRSRGHLGSLSLTGVLAPQLAGRLVEPGLNAVLPILLEVGILDLVVVLGGHPSRSPFRNRGIWYKTEKFN